MVITKLSQKEWAYAVERGLRKKKVEQQFRQQRFLSFINQHRLLSIIIGLGACYEVISIWGWEELFHMLFSWIIGIVVVTTLVASILGSGYARPRRHRR